MFEEIKIPDDSYAMNSTNNVEHAEIISPNTEDMLISPVWDHIGIVYSETQQTSFKLTDLYKAFPLLTEPRVHALCDQLVEAGRLVLSSGRSRVIVYDIDPKAFSFLPKKKEIPMVLEKTATTGTSVVNSLEKKPSKTIRTPSEKSIEKKPKVEVDEMTETKNEYKNDNDNNNHHQYHLHSYKTPTNKGIEDEVSPNSIAFVNTITLSPPEPVMEMVIHFIRALVPNTDIDIASVATLLPKCKEQGIEEDVVRECLKVLMDDNKIFVNNDEIYIM